jgi:phospholipase/carboxylesterase
MMELEGPALGPKSGAKPKQLVVFLHGYGSNGEDLISLAPYWAPLLPEAEFLSPNAPFPCALNPFGGYQWFGFEDVNPMMMLGALRAAATMLDAFLDSALAQRGLDERALALVGFSQGTMMGLHVGLRRKSALAAIVGYSGSLIAPELLAAEKTASPPVLLVHGMADTVVPHAALGEAERALKAAQVEITAESRPGLPHSIDQRGLELGGAFLQRAFKTET